mmetsp:Transcript_18099/g.51505  ORF Transcript_18099/g.51505 Transcript_18099/m.51505 type:complete len:288 (-) Transcript_18099:1224-2087(-)
MRRVWVSKPAYTHTHTHVQTGAVIVSANGVVHVCVPSGCLSVTTSPSVDCGSRLMLCGDIEPNPGPMHPTFAPHSPLSWPPGALPPPPPRPLQYGGQHAAGHQSCYGPPMPPPPAAASVQQGTAVCDDAARAQAQYAKRLANKRLANKRKNTDVDAARMRDKRRKDAGKERATRVTRVERRASMEAAFVDMFPYGHLPSLAVDQELADEDEEGLWDSMYMRVHQNMTDCRAALDVAVHRRKACAVCGINWRVGQQGRPGEGKNECAGDDGGRGQIVFAPVDCSMRAP